MIRRLMVIVLAFVVCRCCAAAAENASPHPEVVKKVLDNGMMVVVKPEKGSGLVAIVAMVKAGAAQETIQTGGIGNFVAQLLLASTRISRAEDVAAVADEVGGNISAQWHPDYTEIRTVTTAAMFTRAMRLIGECLTEANFEPQWVEKVRADLLQRNDTKTDQVFEDGYNSLRELLYEDNGYRRPALGFRRTLKVATPEDLRQFFKTYYVPNNIIISIAGDVTAEQAIERVQGVFGGYNPGKLPKDRGVPDERLDRSKSHAMEVDLPVAYLMLGWLAPGLSSPDYPAMAVAANALGGGKGSLMFRELRQKRGMGYDVGTSYPRLRYQSHLMAYIVTDPFKWKPGSSSAVPVLEEIKSALLEQVNTLKQQPLPENDLQRAKGYTIGTFALTQQHLIDRAFELGWFEAIGVGYETYWKFADDVDKLTAADVQRVANKYLNNYAAVLLMPKPRSAPTEPKPTVGAKHLRVNEPVCAQPICKCFAPTNDWETAWN